jgi:thiosulfate reductase / polysulfide reductase chain A
MLITGGNFRPIFHSENRQLGIGTREQYPDPIMDIHYDTAREKGIKDGDRVYIEIRRGPIRQRAKLTDEIDPGVREATPPELDALYAVGTSAAAPPSLS